jgi:hypothetical protein
MWLLRYHIYQSHQIDGPEVKEVKIKGVMKSSERNEVWIIAKKMWMKISYNKPYFKEPYLVWIEKL